VSLAVAGVLFWAVVLRDPPTAAGMACSRVVRVSPAAVYSLADHYLVDPLAYALLAGVLFLLHCERLTLAAFVCVAGVLDKEPVLFAAPIVLLLAVRARAWQAAGVVLAGVPALYLVIHRTDLIAKGAGQEFPYFTAANLSDVISRQGAYREGSSSPS
jgi:hypothetical protein